MQAQNGEYQQMVNQTNDKYEESLHELSIVREQLNSAHTQIEQYNETIQSLNHDLINNTKSSRNGQNNLQKSQGPNQNGVDYKQKLETLQKQYNELLAECTSYRNEHVQMMEQQLEQQIQIEELMKFEKRNKSLSDQIIELTYNNVELEKEINECSMELDEQNQIIQNLQAENGRLMVENQKKILSPVQRTKLQQTSSNNSHSSDRKQTSISPKIRAISPEMTNGIIHHNDIDDDHMMTTEDDEHEHDLFSMVQTYEDNDQYLLNENEQEMEEKDQMRQSSTSVSPKLSSLHLHLDEMNQNKSVRLRDRNKGHSHGHARVLDAQEEYLHLTASAVKIKYPTVATTISELLSMYI